jgi:hypothetical protein
MAIKTAKVKNGLRRFVLRRYPPWGVATAGVTVSGPLAEL